MPQNSNPKLVARYRKANKICELSQFEWIPAKHRCSRPSEINHIFSVRRRWDLLSVIIHLSKPSHDWFHANPIEGRILCLLVKCRKGEMDPDEIKTAGGMFPLGWIEKNKPRLEWIDPYLDELRFRLKAIEAAKNKLVL